MGTFNILKTEIKCGNCDQVRPVVIQFRFGDTWQLVYQLGEKLIWGGNDIGKANLNVVNVYGYSGDNLCPHCNKFFEEEEFDIRIERDFITAVSAMKNYKKYQENEDDEYYEVND